MPVYITSFICRTMIFVFALMVHASWMVLYILLQKCLNYDILKQRM